MSKPVTAAALVSLLALAGCGGGPKGVFANGKGPDEFVVGRAAPLVVPPDFALVPPRPGQPRPQEADSSTQALGALFGSSAAPRSPAERALTAQAGNTPAAGMRTQAGDPATTVVDKGQTTRDILNAPASTNPQANATTPQ